MPFDLQTWREPHVTVAQLARYFGIDKRTIHRMITRGSLPATRTPGTTRRAGKYLVPTLAARREFRLVDPA